MGGDYNKTHCTKGMTKSAGCGTGGPKGSQHWLN